MHRGRGRKVRDCGTHPAAPKSLARRLDPLHDHVTSATIVAMNRGSMTDRSMTDPSHFDFSLFLPYMLEQAAEASGHRFFSLAKDRHALLATDGQVLLHLGLYGRLTAQEISTRAALHKTKVSRSVQRLEGRNFVCRSADETDRRREPLDLTPTGQTVFEDLQDAALAHEAELLRDISTTDLATLRNILSRLTANGRKGIRT